MGLQGHPCASDSGFLDDSKSSSKNGEIQNLEDLPPPPTEMLEPIQQDFPHQREKNTLIGKTIV